MQIEMTKLKPFGVQIQSQKIGLRVEDLDCDQLKSLFNQYQLILLRGFKGQANSESFARYCNRWGTISRWPFGDVLELKEQDRPQDHIFDHRYVPMHWDGMYRPQVPEVQLFECVCAPSSSTGGETTFTHTRRLIEALPSPIKTKWKKISAVYRRKMEFYDSVTESPLIDKHPYRDYEVLRFNEPHLETRGRLINPVEMSFKGISAEEIGSFYDEILSFLYDDRFYYAHQWQDNDLVIADNFTLLHGRNAFTSSSNRYLRRVQVLSDPVYNNPGLESYQ